MRDGFSVADMTPRIGGTGDMTPHIPDLELGAVSGSGKGGGGYERVRADERV